MQQRVENLPTLVSTLVAGVLLLAQCGAGTGREGHSQESPSGSEATMQAEPTPHGRPEIPSPEEIANLPPDGGDRWNRLVFERSPYLLQHAGNPVDWYPWGPEAFEKAKAEDKPIFLSVGYSTCHWCHVMEHESFLSEEIAAILNEHYVAIKVDREERPDIDNIYMTAVQAMTRGRGGWPLSAFLTPEAKPFFGGTYFPPDDRYGRPGFRSLLTSIADAWKSQRGQITQSTVQLVEILERSNRSRGGTDLGVETLRRAAGSFAARFDSIDGGFGERPKFPTAHNLSFLLRHWHRTGDAHALKMVEQTLQKMADGGIYDHLGGGFHRYSTDREWLVPHFEKMLYDQAILARAYLEAFQATGDEAYAEVARGVFRYVLRDMTDPEGGFYSAEDADSEGEEGTFYVWRPEQIIEILGGDLGRRFNETYGVTDAGNFGNRTSILHLNRSLEAVAASRRVDPVRFREEMSEARERLRLERGKRIPPLRDDKIITAWNGLMISAMAFGSQVLNEPRFREAASRAADFVLEKLETDDGRLLRHYRQGAAAIPGYINDYAFFANALIDVYEATFDPRYLTEAIALVEKMEALFWDSQGGGFSFQGTDGEELLIRPKEVRDGAIPSGNSIAALALLRLGSLTADPKFTRRADEILASFSGDIAQAPSGHAQMLIALDYAIGPTVEIVLAGEPDVNGLRAMLEALHRRFVPNKVVALRPTGENGARIAALAPFLSEQEAIGGRVTAYVCRNHACSLPTHDPAEMVSLIEADQSPGGD